jgi:hypothetical protein
VEGPASFFRWTGCYGAGLREVFLCDSPAAIRGLTGGPPGLTGWFGSFHRLADYRATHAVLLI